MNTREVRRLYFLILFLLQVTPIAYAQDQGTEVLQQKLQQRDQVILELLERVEALERQLGVQPARSKKSSSVEPETVSDEQKNVGIEADRVKQEPGRVVADESAAERALERSLTRDGALLLSSGVLEIEPRLVYSRQEDSTPSFVTAGSNIIASETERNSEAVTANLLFRLGLPGDLQLEVGLPYRWRESETVTNIGFTPTSVSSQSGDGVGDVRFTIAKTLLREDGGLPDVIGRLTWDTDTGKSSDKGVALGGGFNEVQGTLTFLKRQDPVVFVGSLSYEYSYEKDSVQPGEIFAASFGSYIALNPQTSLNFTFSSAFQQEARISGSPFPGSDRTIATFFIGGSTLIGPGTLLNLSLGMGLTDDADDFSISLSLPVRLDI